MGKPSKKKKQERKKQEKRKKRNKKAAFKRRKVKEQDAVVNMVVASARGLNKPIFSVKQVKSFDILYDDEVNDAG